MRRGLGAFLAQVVAALAAYTGARWIWGRKEGAFADLPRELLTFALLWLLLRALIGGWALARKGK
jgi:hypothetical protein